jgi:hypothetical protein
MLLIAHPNLPFSGRMTRILLLASPLNPPFGEAEGQEEPGGEDQRLR